MYPYSKPTLKISIISTVLCMLLTSAYGQDADWSLINGKAIAQRTISITGKTSKEIYRDVNRWLIMVYTNPEDILKARLDDEYLRGVAFVPNCIKTGSISGAGMQYTFAIEIKDELLIFKIYDAFLIFPNSQDDDGNFPIEHYIADGTKRREGRRDDAEHILASITDFSDSRFKNLENYIVRKSIY